MRSLSGRLQQWAPRTAPQATAWLVGGVSLLHLLVAGRVGLGVDEAHYGLYALHPAWSYFDHPPLVGWLQMPALALLGRSELALRVVPVLLGALGSALLYRTARRWFPEEGAWLGFWSVALLQGAIMFQLVSLSMVPDTPLLVLGLLAMGALWRVLEQEQARAWLAVGLWFGLAGLAKYTAVVLVLVALVLLVWGRQWRWLRTPWPWLGAALALLLVAPVLVWNAQHDWLSFTYQLEHGTEAPGWSLQRFALSQAAQVAAYAPALWLGGLVAAVSGLRRERAHPGVRHSVVLGLAVLVLFGWNAGYTLTLPHWTLLGWAALAPLAARWLRRARAARWVRGLAWTSGVYAAVLIVGVHSQFAYPWWPFPAGDHPLRDLYGWQRTARAAERIRRAMPADAGAPVLFVENWTLASRLAWYAYPTPVVVLDDRRDQFDLWFGPPWPGQSGVLVRPHWFATGGPPVERFAFERCEALEPLRIRVRGKHASTFRLYRCHDWQGEEPA